MIDHRVNDSARLREKTRAKIVGKVRGSLDAVGYGLE
jgi:hypothetical protein